MAVSSSSTRRGKKGSLSRSPLAEPNSLIHILASKVQDFMHLPVPDSLYVVLGTLAANMMKGDPVWLIVVGAPSQGKGIVRTVMGIGDDYGRVHDLGNLTGEASLLSGVSRKDIEKGATGGILRQVGMRGCLIAEDLTSTLSGMSFDQRNEVMDAFRKVYNGWWTRAVGTDGGKTLSWGPGGKIGLIAGATPEIDAMYSANAALGDRWVYYRLPSTSGYQESMVSANNPDPDKTRTDMREWVTSFFAGMGLEFGCQGDCRLAHEHRAEPDRRELHDGELQRIFSMSSFIATARSGVPRDHRSHEVNDVTKAEAPMRLNLMLGQLYRGLEAIGLEAEERWRVVGKVAIDSCPARRMKVILELAAVDSTLTVAELRERLKVSIGTVRRTIEDLMIHGVVIFESKGRGRVARDEEEIMGRAGLSKWAKESLERGWGKDVISAYVS